MRWPKNNKLFTILTAGLFAFPIMPYAVRTVFLAVWALFGLYLFLSSTQKTSISRHNIRLFGICVAPYLLLLISLLYSTDSENGVNTLIKMLPLVICPLIFGLTQKFLLPNTYSYIKPIFIGSVLAITLYTSYQVYDNYDFLNRPLTEKDLELNGETLQSINQEKTIKIKYRRIKQFAEEVSGTHSTYFGLYIILSLFFLGGYVVQKKQKILIRIVGVILGLLLLYWLLFLSVRGAILAMGVGLLAFLFSQMRSTSKSIILSIGIVLTLGLLYLNSPALKVRVDEVYTNGLKLPTEGKNVAEYNSTNVRLGSLYCSLEIIKENWILGVGIGDVQDYLDSCYQEKIGAEIYTWRTYNSHNQYLYFGIACGLIGLIVFLFQTLFFIKFSFQNQLWVGLYFFICMAVIFMTENVLLRASGIMYYALFSSLILFVKPKS